MTPDTEDGHVRRALRDATKEDHLSVDTVFARLRLDSVDDYRAFLTAHARAVAALEPASASGQSRLGLLRDDMAALDAPWPEPLPLANDDAPGFGWGVAYALEGSRLGGAMLSRQVGDGFPTGYLGAVHGRGEWKAFQHALDRAAAEGGQGWLDDAVQGARSAFALFAAAGTMEKAAVHGG